MKKLKKFNSFIKESTNPDDDSFIYTEEFGQELESLGYAKKEYGESGFQFIKENDKNDYFIVTSSRQYDSGPNVFIIHASNNKNRQILRNKLKLFRYGNVL
jgi:hypothetical protein